MKKLLFTILTLLTVFGLTIVSCTKDPITKKHVYTEEELTEKALLDSLKHKLPADYIFTQNVTLPINRGYDGMTVQLCPDTSKLLTLFEYGSVAELVAGLGTVSDGVQSGNDIKFFAFNNSTKYAYTSPSTTNYFGHWFDGNGDVCSWGDNAYLFMEKQDTFSLKFTLGMYPGHATEGSVYTIIEAMKLAKYTIAFVFNVTIGPKEVITTTVVGTDSLKFDAALNSDYTPTVLDYDISAITSAIGAAPALSNLFGVDANGTVETSHTSTYGCWFDSSGNVCSYGNSGCALYVEIDEANNKINVGQFPDGCVVGQTYYAVIGFINNNKQYNVVIKITITAATR